MKTCKRCGEELPLSRFYAHKMMADGRLNFCIECVRRRVSEHRANNLEEVRKRDRARGFRVYDREHVLARYAIRNAIRRGEVMRQPCWCGEKADAHHPDHSKPLDVEWLCHKHHGEQHRRFQ